MTGDTAHDNIHATAVLIRERGVLVTGRSGAGKTTLALALIDHFAARGLFCRLVADDRLLVAGINGRIVAGGPETIAGLIDVPGLGPRPLISMPAAVIDLGVRLVAPDQALRFQDDATMAVAGCALPCIDVAERNPTAAIMAIAARLALVPFR